MFKLSIQFGKDGYYDYEKTMNAKRLNELKRQKRIVALKKELKELEEQKTDVEVIKEYLLEMNIEPTEENILKQQEFLKSIGK